MAHVKGLTKTGEWNEAADDITVNALTVGTGAVTIRTVPYTFPAVQGAAATFLTNDGSGVVTWVAAAVQNATLIWGNLSVLDTVTTRYLQPGYGAGNAPVTTLYYRMPRAAHLKNMRVHFRLAGVGAATLTFTLMVNDVASALVAAGSNAATDLTDLTHTVTVAAGDLIGIMVTKSAGITTSPADIMVSVEEAP